MAQVGRLTRPNPQLIDDRTLELHDQAPPERTRRAAPWIGRGPGRPASVPIGATVDNQTTGGAVPGPLPSAYAAPVCLLLFAWQVESSYPLTVAANRDERLERPARSFEVLREQHPRVVGGHDDLAGGTWLAINEHGVVAGLTNRPSPGGRDPTKRTRGELPLVLTGERTAAAGVETLVRRVRPNEYNPAWLLVGDRRSLFYLEMVPDRPISVRQLAPGFHVLENAPLDQPSPKSERIGSLVSEPSRSGGPLWSRLPSVLADHMVPSTVLTDGPDPEPPVTRLPATLAACVHTEGYGTRSSTLVRVPTAPNSQPQMLVADGPPCTTSFVEVTSLWAR